MRILQLAPPWMPVPSASGSEYLVPGVLSDGLVHAGHDVTLVASKASRTRAALLDIVDGHANGRDGDITTLLPHVLAAYQRRRDNDVVHDHTELAPALAVIANDTRSRGVPPPRHGSRGLNGRGRDQRASSPAGRHSPQ
jgi:hypothetical protein